MRLHNLLPSVLLPLSLVASSSAQTITVTLCKDTIDVNPFSATVASLPGPDGEVSLSEALIAANNTPGHQTIEFRIPTANWQLQFLYPGRAVLDSLSGTYWRASEEVTLDATTQTAFTGDTNPDGGEVVLWRSELFLNADNCVFRGFDSSSVTLTRGGSVAEDNTGTTNITVWGDGNLVRNNTGGTIKIDRANDNVVVGNTVQRVRVLGFAPGQFASRNRIGGPAPTDRNLITGYGTWSGEGFPGGTTVELVDTRSTLVENNWIGLTPDGLAQGSQASTQGIGLTRENHDVTIKGNRIAGILGHGRGPHYAGILVGQAVLVGGTGSGVVFTGNTIGLDKNGAPLGSLTGVDLGSISAGSYAGLRFGGTAPGEGNTVSGHIVSGVLVGRGMTGVRLQGNSIHGNGGIGIDLVPDGFGFGVTPNDPGDADGGANGLQNFPVLTQVARWGATTRVAGTLDSTPSSTFTLEFFSNQGCDPSGFGEGRTPLGTAVVSTDAGGRASFDLLLSAAVPSGSFASATATAEPLGATSEFSACVPVMDTTCQQNLGFGGPGNATLSLCGGDLSSGTSADLLLRGAAPNQLAFFAAGPAMNPFALFGGTVVPVPPTILNATVTDAGGAVTLSPIQGGGGPLTLYGQFVYLDPTQPLGWGISNALRVDFLP